MGLIRSRYRLFRGTVCCCLILALGAPAGMGAERSLSAEKVTERVRKTGTAKRVTVRLDDGRVLKGSISEVSEETFTLREWNASRPVSIAHDDVAGFYSDKRVKVRLNDGRVLKGSISKISEETFTLIERSTGQPVSIAYQDVVQFKKPLPLWAKITIAVGAAFGLGISLWAAAGFPVN